MNPYSRMIELMEERGAARNGFDLEEAVVLGISPLRIRVGETEVAVNLHCNPALMLELNPSSVQTSETALKQCLNSFYNAFKLNVNDKVLVQRVGNNFYIICKVVDAS